ncbi:hypothetical protein BP5796_11750 [Coleophoma crateriformis]|uniref:AB hydrolase-1 domain-containing protein n=1 Tax=Coleophoma crateriformis TaxID=565419 RepID=A0A3D8QFE8_9HELO|nr:hypothetical protein BP5796_11750 [Coleophoma crateriformis]
MASPLETQNITFLSQRKFHNCFIVPATATHGILRVTYAIAGPELASSADGAAADGIETVLFFGGMFGGRWIAPRWDYAAMKENVRCLIIDRPSFGGSTSVPLKDRLHVSLEVIPPLLSHLGIKYIHLASHSAGTIYSLNFLHRYPELLSPTNPTVTLLSPWVHPTNSGVSLLGLAGSLPNSWLNHWNKTINFVGGTLIPKLASSGTVFTAASNMFKGKTLPEKEKTEENRKCTEAYGVSPETDRARLQLLSQWAREETNVGGNDEARLCLKMVAGECSWDAAEDLPEYVSRLARFWEERAAPGEGKKMRVRAVSAEDDFMIGAQGRKYFETAWEAKCGSGILFDSSFGPGTDHDSLAEVVSGAVVTLFRVAKGEA